MLLAAGRIWESVRNVALGCVCLRAASAPFANRAPRVNSLQASPREESQLPGARLLSVTQRTPAASASGLPSRRGTPHSGPESPRESLMSARATLVSARERLLIEGRELAALFAHGHQCDGELLRACSAGKGATPRQRSGREGAAASGQSRQRRTLAQHDPSGFESGRRGGVGDLGGGGQPTAKASAGSASRWPLARTRNVANAIARPAPARGQKQSRQAQAAHARIWAKGAARDSAVGADRRHLGTASTPRTDYCFDQGASTKAASTRCAFVAITTTPADGWTTPAFPRPQVSPGGRRRGCVCPGSHSVRERCRLRHRGCFALRAATRSTAPSAWSR